MLFHQEPKPCSEKQCRLYLSQIAQGDEKALENLYLGLSTPIFMFAMSYCKNKEMAEDVLQDTFVKLICSISGYRERGHARTWIFTIAKNLCFDMLGRNKPSSEIIEPDSTMDYSVLEVQDALSHLPETERQVIRLHVFAGLKLKEIAAVLNLPIGKVNYAKRNAVKKLKQFYTAQDNDRRNVL